MLRAITFCAFVVLSCLAGDAFAAPKQKTADAGSRMVDAGIASVDAGMPAVRFIAMGDTGKGNPGQYQVGQAIGTLCQSQGCDFVVLLGDNFYPSGVDSTTDPLWQSAFVKPYASVNAPFYAVLGNHDCGANGAGTDFPRGDNQVAYSKVSSKWRMPGRHYTWKVGEVDFFAADTNRSMFGVDAEARADFEKWMPAATGRWKIAFAHHPYLSNGPHGNAGRYDRLPYAPIVNGEGVKRFLDDAVCGRADFYFSGHDHNIQWLEGTCTRPNSKINTQLIVSGGGAATTGLPGNNPVFYQSDKLGFVYVVIRGSELTATFYDADGAERYTRTVKK